jgi:hypothetical protein
VIAALLRSRVRLASRELFARPRGGNWLRHPLIAIVLALWMGSMVLGGMRALFDTLAATGAPPRDLAAALALALSGAFVALVVFDVDDAVRTLVSDSDLELLRRAPIPPALLLALKMLDSGPRTVLPLAVLAVPALIAFAAHSAPSPAFWPAAIAAIAALWAIPMALGTALSLLVLRAVPAARAREALGLLATLTLTLLWVASAVVVPRAIDADASALGGLRAMFARAIEGPAPGAIAARAVAAAAAGATATALRELAWLALAALTAIVAALLVARAALASVLERVGGGAERRLGATAATARAFRWRGGGVAAAVIRRDGRMLRRSLTILGDLAVASALWTLLPLVGAAKWDLPWSQLARLMLVVVSVGLGYEIAARSVPFERHGGYWARIAPIDPGHWLAGKLAGSGLLALPVVTLIGLVLAFTRPISLESWGGTACLVLGALALSVGTGVWAGVLFGDPAWINPRAMLRITGRLATSFLLLAQIALWLGLALAGDELLPPGLGALWLVAPLLGALLALAPVGAARHRLSVVGLPD